MPKEFPQVMYKVYAVLLRIYPRGFRSQFSDEMQDIFSLSIAEASGNGAFPTGGIFLKELFALPVAALRAHQLERRARENAMENADDAKQVDLSTREILIALGIFCIPALLILMNATPDASLSNLLPIALVLVAAIFILGIIRGLSRWSLPYFGFALALFGYLFVFQWVADLVGPALILQFHPGSSDDSTRLILKAAAIGWLWFTLFSYTLLVVAFLAMIRRFRRLISTIRQDWTMLSYILYGEMLFALILLFDDFRFEEPYAIASLLSLAVCGWLYLRSPLPRRRILALVSGLTLAMGIAAFEKWLIGPDTRAMNLLSEIYGGVERWHEPASIMGEWVLMMVALLIPGFLNRITQRGRLLDSEMFKPEV